VAPGTPEEMLLCDLVAELLGMERAGLADNFFHLGGHSLLATRLAAQIRARLGRELPIRTIFDTPVLGDLASALRSLPKAGQPLIRQERPAELPLSFAQARLWFLNQLEGANASYNIPVGFRLHGDLDTAALQSALEDVVARHESLRTRLIEEDHGPQQQIVPTEVARVPLHTRPSSPERLEEDFSAAAAYSFDLAQEMPIRATLLEDVALAYAARRKGEAPVFAPLVVQYADYTLWQRELLGNENDAASPLSRQIEYWREKLADLPAELALPTDRPRPSAPSYAGGVVAITIPPEVHGKLVELARAQGATLFMLLQATLATLLSKLGGGSDIPTRPPGRFLRQHAGAAHRHRRQSDVRGTGPAGPRHLSGGLHASGCAL
jgi:hypothetical protein